MATVWFVKDGEGDEHTNHHPHRVPVQMVNDALHRYQVDFFTSGPVIKPGSKASWSAPYKHIVVEIEESEVGEKFRKAGYYRVIGLAPSVAQTLFNISNPS